MEEMNSDVNGDLLSFALYVEQASVGLLRREVLLYLI